MREGAGLGEGEKLGEGGVFEGGGRRGCYAQVAIML